MRSLMLFLSVFLLITGLAAKPSYSLPYLGADYTLDGVETSNQSSRWFTAGDSVWTAWANQWVEYTIDLEEGNWNFGLNVQNHGNLGINWYSHFEIRSSYGNESETIIIPADMDEAFPGSIYIGDLSEGTYTVRYTWLNDQYAPQWGLDANIQIDSVFFDNTETAPVPEPATIFLLGCGLLGLVSIRKKRS